MPLCDQGNNRANRKSLWVGGVKLFPHGIEFELGHFGMLGLIVLEE